jgi:hypothetical protein
VNVEGERRENRGRGEGILQMGGSRECLRWIVGGGLLFQKVHLDRNVLSGFVYYDKGASHGDGKCLAVEFVDVGSVVVVFHYQVDFVIDNGVGALDCSALGIDDKGFVGREGPDTIDE